MMINEGLPNFIVNNLSRQFDLSTMHVGILGMAFKADIDDIRDSLSFKLRKILKFHGATVLCSDEFAEADDFLDKESLVQQSEIIIFAVPHSAYHTLTIPPHKYVVDLWGVTQTTVLAPC
jgi:UDP-N-acetyl-D-mannosaminuronic acid dehydrogenase